MEQCPSCGELRVPVILSPPLRRQTSLTADLQKRPATEQESQ
jgi:hypothetical protein